MKKIILVLVLLVFIIGCAEQEEVEMGNFSIEELEDQSPESVTDKAEKEDAQKEAALLDLGDFRPR